MTSTATQVAGQQVYPQWEYDLLAGIGAPANKGNLDALNYWGQSENTADQNNPLAVSTKYPGATKCIAQCGGKSEIYAYDTEQDGVAANVSFLLAPSYANIVTAFTKSQGLNAIWSAINNSGWCKGCSGGQYPKVLYQALTNPPPIAALPTGTGTAAAQSGGAPGFGCAAKGPVFSEGGFLGIGSFSFTYCNLKAMVGAACIGGGVAIAIIGVSFTLKNTSAGRAVGKVASVAAL